MTILPPAAARTVAVIIAWNSRDDVLTCLAALAGSEARPATVVVVDNASSDDTVAAVRAAYPAAIVIEEARNWHFARAANDGLAWAQAHGADFAWVLNPDATPEPTALGEMVRVMQSDPTIGIVGARLLHPDRPGRAMRVVVGELCDLETGLVSKPPLPTDPALDRLEVDYVWGCALLVRTSVLRQIGVFDARLVAYHEDSDLCLRARTAGWRTVTALHAPVVHIGSKVGEKRYLNQMWLRGRNWLIVFYRHAAPRQRPKLLLWMFGNRLPRFTKAVVRQLGKRALIRLHLYRPRPKISEL